jgi:hypothetical protein
LTAAEAKGAWLLSVYQVDESPRYASLGRWQHSASFSLLPQRGHLASAAAAGDDAKTMREALQAMGAIK